MAERRKYWLYAFEKTLVSQISLYCESFVPRFARLGEEGKHRAAPQQRLVKEQGGLHLERLQERGEYVSNRIEKGWKDAVHAIGLKGLDGSNTALNLRSCGDTCGFQCDGASQLKRLRLNLQVARSGIRQHGSVPGEGEGAPTE